MIRRARLRAGLSQAQVAAQADMSQPTICDYERARHEPTVASLARVLRACGHRLEVVCARPDPATAGQRLSEVLDLAASIPTRHDQHLRFPPLPRPDP